jgi:putative ABC transport system permease protein
MLESIGQDFRRALRMLGRNPGFACITTLTLAIGIGATTTIFSFVDAVLLRPLPYEHADRIVRILERRPTGATSWFSTLAYLDWKAHSTGLERMAAYQLGLATLTGYGDPIPLRVGRVTADYFNVFGVRAFIGRTFAEGDDTPGRHQVVVLSHALWSSRFGGDPHVIGRPITLDNQAYVVVGVLPAGSAFDRGTAQIWYPLAFLPMNMNWDYRWLNASFAVLKPGVSIEQARSELHAIADRIAGENPNSHKGWSIAIERYGDSIVGPQTRTSLLALMAAVAGLLLICCSNLASLMLVRAVSKEGEVAVRASLGASRVRLLQQLGIEYFVLTVGGAAFGVGVAAAALAWLNSVLPPGTFPSEADVRINSRVLTFALALALVSGFVFALAPAMRACSRSLLGSMQDTRRGSTIRPARRRLLDALVVGEVAVAFVLLCGSALLIRSFAALITVDTGFATSRIVTMGLPVAGFPPGSGYATPAEFTTYLNELVRSVDAIPGVHRAAVTNALPLTDCCLYGLSMQVANRPVRDRANRGGGFFKVVTPSYFETLGLTLRRGRFLDERDVAGGVPAIVINERLAARDFPGEDPIGKHILNPRIIPGRTERGADLSWEIVGVVANEKIGTLNDDTSAVVYASYEQSPVYFANLAIRTDLGPEAAARAVRQTLQRLSPSQAIMDVRTLEQIMATSTASGRLQTALMTMFSGVALLLAAIGMYGVLAYSVALRVREIGIRAALGASSSALLRVVLAEGVSVTMLGLAIGVIAAMLLTPLLSSVLYRVEPHDPYLMTGAVAILVPVSMLACAIPARRAARIDPIVALRVE